MLPDLNPLVYLFTVPTGGFVGSLIAVGLTAARVHWGWAAAAVAVGLYSGKKWGDYLY